MEKGNQFVLGVCHSFQNTLRDGGRLDGTDADPFRTFQTMKSIDDVQKVFSNADFPEDALREFSEDV